ncbi:MAG: riboflavin synthase [Bacteroidota bacterium]|nr:riboflavin synthase [Bacteroidota bacterium]
MFSGIIEELGIVENVISMDENKSFIIKCSFAHELKVDQSVAHNGACLTVTKVFKEKYMVTAIKETLGKTNLNYLKVNDQVNLERCLKLNDRLDGHMVQGHVDQTARCIERKDLNGSCLYTFKYEANNGNITVEKGSICVNGISLTVVNSQDDTFSVAIIPYTFENTNLKYLEEGQLVNLEFDIIGKYVGKYLKNIKI